QDAASADRLDLFKADIEKSGYRPDPFKDLPIYWTGEVANIWQPIYREGHFRRDLTSGNYFLQNILGEHDVTKRLSSLNGEELEKKISEMEASCLAERTASSKLHTVQTLIKNWVPKARLQEFLDLPDKDGHTPVSRFIYYGGDKNLEVVKYLIDQGCNPWLPD